MKIVISGTGKVGATLAQELSAEGHDLTMIDWDDEVLNTCVNQFDVTGVQGNGASMEVLERAGVQDADLLIATANADEINLLCCTTARSMNPRIHTIARIRNPEYSRQVYAMKDVFGLSLAVNPERQTALEIERLLKYPGFLKRDTFAKGRVEIVELSVSADSKMCNATLAELGDIVKCRVLVCAVLRNGVAIAPDGQFTLQPGDRVFVTAPTGNLTALLKNLGLIAHKAKRVMLIGGGRVSYYLAQLLLKGGVSVRILERDMDRCRELCESLPDADIIHGDASNRMTLESERVADCDALVTLTGLDELNIITSLYANSCGVPHVITKVGHSGAGNLLNSLPLGSVVCPKDLCADLIVRYVRAMQNQTGAALSVHAIADGQVEATEFVVDADTRNCGVPLRELRLKPDVLLVAISHGEKIEIASGTSVLHRGDTVVLVSGSERVIYHLNDIFE